MRSFSRHLGSTVSAMVDGQLPPAELDRAWRHVLGCASCRAEVEREMWLKQRLASLGAPPCPTERITESLSGWQSGERGEVVTGWSSVVSDYRHPRRGTGVAIGVGAASVVALMGWGLTAVVGETGSAPAGANVGGSPSARPTPTTFTGPGGSRSSEGLPAPLR
ncbi:anti-sigma factor family protein [Nocardioides caldifontis]|uniref:anti-sigma factor family protein n=1 Tax=Nocardioides caldifontis TaxID=2588938 RepID=UPI0011DFC55A|nr:zf-HC2 domain-containing protein [Nocardioides caldifontis]